ncbi:MAG: hypothetical protein SynsKO_03290 [Synoicihabitans sp.]
MRRVISLFLSCICCCGTFATPESASTDADKGFIFASVKVAVELETRRAEIDHFDGKKFYLKGIKRPIRPSGGIPADLEPLVAISDLYTEISDFDFKFSDSGASLESIAATGTANAMVARAEFTPTPGVTSRGGRIQIVGPTSSQTDEFRDFQIIEEGIADQSRPPPRENRLLGQIKGKGELVADRTITHAYAVLFMEFSRTFPGDEVAHLAPLTRIIRVGNLAAGKKKKLKFTLTFPKLLASEAELRIFLFDGAGKPIATNLSHDLRELTPAQLKEWREMENKP